MKSCVVAGAFVFFAFPGLWLCQARCDPPQLGRCSSSNFTINSDEVCDVETGSCDFTQSSGLCYYRQGCADPHMTNWTLENGKIQAEQSGAGNCPSSKFYYSVLESPWLNISHPSCLKVRYRRTTPAALDVFLELRTGRVLPFISRSGNAKNNKNATCKSTVERGIGKILLRAYGGGGGGRSVIYKVTLEPGHCTWPGSHDITNAEPPISPLLSPTQEAKDRIDCLKFSYIMDQPRSWLAVSIQLLLEERRTVIWNYSNSEPVENDGKCPIQVSAPFKIIFTAYSPDSGVPVGISDVDFFRWQGNEDCFIEPFSASTSHTGKVVQPTEMDTSTSSDQCSTHPPSTASTSSTPGPVLTTSSVLFTSISVQSVTLTTSGHSVDPFTDDGGNGGNFNSVTDSNNGDGGNGENSNAVTDSNKGDGGNGENSNAVTGSNNGDGGNGENSNAVTDSRKGDGDNSNSALIPGVVAAVAVVIIVIIIIVAVILIRRRGSLKRDQNKSLTQQDRKDGIVASKPQDNNNHDYSEIRASHFFPAPEDDSGYFELEAVASHPPDLDFDPYEQIPGDAPGRAEGPEEDDYNHLNAGGLPVKANPQESGDDDDYHHINTPGSTTDPRTSSVYSLAQIQRNSADQPGLRYTYSQVNKKGRKTTVEDAPDPTNAYNRVNKKAQKPAVALKPPGKHGQSGAMTRKPQDYCLANLDEISDSYNRINTTTARNHPTTSDDNQDPATDPYNRIHLTSDPGQKGKSSSPDDDYNALDFDDPTHASRVAIGSYDHVRSNPDDEYSKTGFGKRLVIDSSYDHVELDS